MSEILVLSNGHGEDLSGSLLSKELIKRGHKVDALPLVGNGNDYKNEKINIIVQTKEFKTGGLGYTSLKGRLQELIDGQIIYLLNKLLLVFSIRKKYDYFLVVGDIVPILFAWLSKKKSFVYLVAYSSHYEGKLKLPWPCGYFLRSSKIKKIYSRDLLTSIDLSNQLQREINFFGNPFMDKFLIPNKKSKEITFNIAFLPGSRLPELENNFALMLDLLQTLSKYKYFDSVEFNFALINSFKRDRIIRILKKRKWLFSKNKSYLNNLFFEFKFIKVRFKSNYFEQILINSNLVVSMAGTASEQAIGLSKPVIQMEGLGPQFTKSFAEAQRRLLGKNVYCATEYNNKQDQIDQTIGLILKVIYFIKLDKNFLLACHENSINRLGTKGASKKIIKDIDSLLNS